MGYEPKPTSMRENCKLNLEIFGLDGANGTFCAILGSRSTGWGLAWLTRREPPATTTAEWL